MWEINVVRGYLNITVTSDTPILSTSNSSAPPDLRASFRNRGHLPLPHDVLDLPGRL